VRSSASQVTAGMSKQATFDKVGLLGVDIDAASSADAISYICTRAAPGQPAAYITKPYVEFIDRAYHQPKLQDLINGAELTLADGVALVWAAHYLYAGRRSFLRFWSTLFRIVLAPNSLRWPLTNRTAGITFTWPLLEQAAHHHLRVYLIGSPRGTTIEHTAAVLEHAIPGLHIVGTRSGHDTTAHPGAVTDGWLENTAAKPDLILVGMGFPLQEAVCAYLAAHTTHGLYIGEGGTFDYDKFGGRRPKAPQVVQTLGLEWLWRLMLEPRRLRRQLAIPRFIYRIWRHR
jgi:N-acetylglucosaminyldiphosphoundecaprenol N-acetyl-beta-D-mannosaminyltransferase